MRIGPTSACVVAFVAASTPSWSALDPRADGPPAIVTSSRPAAAQVAGGVNEPGQTVIAWYGVEMRLYDASGRAVSGVLKVDEGAGGFDPRAAIDAGGNVVVVWDRMVGTTYADYRALMRLFDAAGNPLGPEVLVDPDWSGGTLEPVVARARGGRFAVVWKRNRGTANGTIWFRAFDPRGGPLGPANPITLTPPPPDVDPVDLAVDASGEYVLVFGPTNAVRLDALGNQLGAPFRAGSNRRSVQRSPDGRFVVGWQYRSDLESPADSCFETFAADASPIATTCEYTPLDDGLLAIGARAAMSARGDVVLSYVEQTYPLFDPRPALRTYDVRGQDASAFTLLADPEYVEYPHGWALPMSARGDYALAYQTYAGIHAQRYCADMRVRGPEARVACTGGSAFFSVEATGRMPVAYRWRKNGVDLAESSRVTGTHGSTLVIDPVEAGDAGNYDCVITDACPAGGSLTSASVALTVGTGARIAAVGGLNVARTGSSLTLTWTDVPGATDYVVYEDVWPDTGFRTVTGTATSGTTGVTIPLPRSERFYRVVGRSAACGAGRP